MYKKIFFITSLFFLFSFFTSCNDSPEKVYKKLSMAAKEGNIDKFCSYFTVDTREVVKGIIALVRDYGVKKNKNPMKYIAGGEVVSEEIKGDYATVTVRFKRRKRKILFVRDKKDGNKWRIDLFLLEKFWKKGSKIERVMK